MYTNKILIAFVLIVVLTLFYTSCSKDEETITPPPNQTTNNNDINITFDIGAGVTFDGYTYSSIVLGNGQEWLAENLRTTIYCNGDPIPNVTDGTQWSNLTTGAWVFQENDSQYENPYGKLYNWYAVGDSRNVCPCGWHVPSDTELLTLVDYLGGETVAGGKMKSTNTQYWNSPNTDATNTSGFTGLAAGQRTSGGTFGNIGFNLFCWSSTENNTNNAWIRSLSNNNGNAERLGFFPKENGMSIRCIKD